MPPARRVPLEFFFDYSSPWTYLAFVRLQDLVRDYAAQNITLDIAYKPFLVGAVFNKINPSVYEMRKNPVPAKAKYNVRDMQEWSDAFGLKIRQPYGANPPDPFPVNSAKALRGGLYALERGGAGAKGIVEYSHKVFHTYWVDGRDISDVAVLEELAGTLGYDPAAFVDYIQHNDAAKAALRANTQALMDRGGFGTPTVCVGGGMYFGNDRMPLVQRRIDLVVDAGRVGDAGAPAWAWRGDAKM